MPTIGDSAKIRTATARFQSAQVAIVESGTTVTLDVYSDGSAWEDSAPPGVLVRRVTGVAQGSAVGEWQASALTSGVVALASTTYVDTTAANVETDISNLSTLLSDCSAIQADTLIGNGALGTAIAALPTFSDVAAAITAVPDASSRCAQASAGSAVTLALNTARNPSTVRGDSRGTRVRVSGTWTSTITASGTVDLRSDSASTPTTVRDNQLPAVTLAIGVGVTVPWSLQYDVPSGHYYTVATSGTGTFAITHINETVQ